MGKNMDMVNSRKIVGRYQKGQRFLVVRHPFSYVFKKKVLNCYQQLRLLFFIPPWSDTRTYKLSYELTIIGKIKRLLMKRRFKHLQQFIKS